MMDLEKTYLRVALVTSLDQIHASLKNIYGDTYTKTAAQYFITGKLKQIDPRTGQEVERSVASQAAQLRQGVQEKKLRPYNVWMVDVSRALCKYLNSVYSVYEESRDGVDSILRHMQDEFYIEPNVVTDELTRETVLSEEQEDAIDHLYTTFDNIVASQRELFDRPSDKELIRFTVVPGSAYISIEFWGDNRIHLYNQMMKSKG